MLAEPRPLPPLASAHRVAVRVVLHCTADPPTGSRWIGEIRNDEFQNHDSALDVRHAQPKVARLTRALPNRGFLKPVDQSLAGVRDPETLWPESACRNTQAAREQALPRLSLPRQSFCAALIGRSSIYAYVACNTPTYLRAI
jgi:hypothetical protein